MENAVIREVNYVLADYTAQRDEFDGLIYIMYRLSSDEIIPLYIGKAEKLGKNGGNLSENIKDIDQNKGKLEQALYARPDSDRLVHRSDRGVNISRSAIPSVWSKPRSNRRWVT